MNEMKMANFEQNDKLQLTIFDEPEKANVELGPNITAELNDEGEFIGIEILNANAFIRDSVLESMQAKMLAWAKLIVRVPDCWLPDHFAILSRVGSLSRYPCPDALV